jgi:OFA family oxalate/formate antiporter-like MFS transporter
MSDVGAAVALATIAIGLLSAGSAAGRLLFGILFYRIGRDRVMAIIGVYLSLISLLIAAAYMIRLPVVLAILFCLYGIGYGGIATFRPSYISSVFGLKHFKRNMSCTSVFTLAFMPYVNVIGIIKTRTGSYQMYFYVMAVCAVIAVLITPLNIRSIRQMEIKYSNLPQY